MITQGQVDAYKAEVNVNVNLKTEKRSIKKEKIGNFYKTLADWFIDIQDQITATVQSILGIQQNIDVVSGDLIIEREERISGDSTLNTKITNEVFFRTSADQNLQNQISLLSGNQVESWTDVLEFTYDGTNNIQTLAFTPKKIGITFFVNQSPLNPFLDFYYDGNKIVLLPSILTEGIEYKLITQYYK